MDHPAPRRVADDRTAGSFFAPAKGWAAGLAFLACVALSAAIDARGRMGPIQQRRIQPPEQRQLQILFDPEPPAAGRQQRRVHAPAAVPAGIHRQQFPGRPGNVAQHLVAGAAGLSGRATASARHLCTAAAIAEQQRWRSKHGRELGTERRLGGARQPAAIDMGQLVGRRHGAATVAGDRNPDHGRIMGGAQRDLVIAGPGRDFSSQPQRSDLSRMAARGREHGGPRSRSGAKARRAR